MPVISWTCGCGEDCPEFQSFPQPTALDQWAKCPVHGRWWQAADDTMGTIKWQKAPMNPPTPPSGEE